MQNYSESTHPRADASRAAAPRREGSGVSPRQLLGVILAAVLVAIVLSLFTLLAARIDPGGEDCTLTDNAGCIEIGRVGSSSEAVAGVDAGREGLSGA